LLFMKTESKEFLTFANHTSENSPKAQFFGYVRKNQPFLIIFNYIIEKFPIIVFVNINSQNSTNLEIFGIKFHKCMYFLYFEENLSTQCTNLGKFGHCNEQKVWKTGHRNEQIPGIIAIE
jgi:hypothetical protein